MKVVGSLTCASCLITYKDMAIDNTENHTGWICDSCKAERQGLSATNAGYASAVREITEQLKQEFISMIGGYKTVYIGYAHEVASHQFLYKQEVDNYFNNILPGYLEKLLKQATASA